MTNHKFDIPAEWGDPLGELMESARLLPEDEEDRWIREGAAKFATMTLEEQARIRRMGDEILERMQTPESRTAADRAFKELGQRRDDSQST